MKNHLGIAIVLSLSILSPAFGAGVDLASDPLWQALMRASVSPVPASSFGGGSGIEASCTASCGSTSVSCSGSGSCVAVDQDCPFGQGYVTCGSVTTYCPPCTPNCSQQNTPSCQYTWDPVRSCCVAGDFCPNNCLN